MIKTPFIYERGFCYLIKSLPITKNIPFNKTSNTSHNPNYKKEYIIILN